MKPHTILFLLLFIACNAFAQRGDIVILVSNDIFVPDGAQLCADRFFANNPGYGTLTLANSSCLCPGAVIIPVELLSFSASLEKGIVTLTWSTASETNCSGYRIERSPDAYAWDSRGFVQGNGTATHAREYRACDKLEADLLRLPVLYYRLKQVDFDGSYEYSPTAEVHPSQLPAGPKLFPIIPNPAGDMVAVQFSLPQSLQVSVRIVSIIGQEVYCYTGEHSRGVTVLNVNTRSLTPGMYFVEFATKEETLIELFIKR